MSFAVVDDTLFGISKLRVVRSTKCGKWTIDSAIGSELELGEYNNRLWSIGGTLWATTGAGLWRREPSSSGGSIWRLTRDNISPIREVIPFDDGTCILDDGSRFECTKDGRSWQQLPYWDVLYRTVFESRENLLALENQVVDTYSKKDHKWIAHSSEGNTDDATSIWASDSDASKILIGSDRGIFWSNDFAYHFNGPAVVGAAGVVRSLEASKGGFVVASNKGLYFAVANIPDARAPVRILT